MPNKWENKDDMKRMQQEAIRRVQEMQSKAKEKISKTTLTLDPVEHQKSAAESPIKNKLKLKKRFNPIGNLLSSVSEDSEKNLILMLVLLLMEDNADFSIILSLMYLIV